MWPSAATSSRPATAINYGLAPPEMGMVGLRDLFVVAHHGGQHEPANIISDPHSINGSIPATALGVGVIPLLTATPCLAAPPHGMSGHEDHNISRGGIHLWQNQQLISSNQHGHYLKKQPNTLHHHDHHNTNSGNMVQGGGSGIGGGGIGGSSSSGSTATCQDCGNQAKKDCSHRRCRTCCKSRGFVCATHVKSTWVPAARRRERQLMSATAAPQAGSSGSTSGAKKPRLIASRTTTSPTSTSNTTPRSFDTSSSHQDGSFKEALPGQVRAPAVFKCVRVTAVEDGEDEYAYQAVVKIGGHVFKGFLYDQGVETRDSFPNISELHLGGGINIGNGGGGGGGGGGRNGGSSSSPILDPNEVFGASGGGLLGDTTTYGNQIN